MAFDAHVNFGYSTVATAPSPASSGTSLVVAAGEGADFPTPPFDAVVWPAGANPRKTTAEVVRVTGISTDTFTITRAQESSSARTIIVGDQIADAVTAKTLTDIEGNVDSVAPVTQAFADVADSGASAIFARRDHKHGMPSIPIGTPMLVYRYTVTGSDKASIDTGVDTPDAGSNDWTDGDLLEVFLYGRTDEAVVGSPLTVLLNNDSGGNYDRQRVRGLSTTASAGRAAADTAMLAWQVAGSSALPDLFSSSSLTMPAYMSGHLKSGFAQSGVPDNTASSIVDLWSIGYRSTSAISRLSIAVTTAAKKFKVGTQLLIYKRKAS